MDILVIFIILTGHRTWLNGAGEEEHDSCIRYVDSSSAFVITNYKISEVHTLSSFYIATLI